MKLFLFLRQKHYFTGTFNTRIRISSFNKIPVPAFPCRDNRKIPKYFYHACSYAKADYSRFMNVTAKIALHLISEQLKSQPVFLCIDDTMISKFGTKFENASKLFDHAAHNGCNYLNGHCFVSLMLCVPVWNHDKISYLAVPLGYRMWQKKNQNLSLLHPWCVR